MRLPRLVVRRWPFGLQPTAGRSGAHAQRRRDCLRGQAAPVQPGQLLVAVLPLGTPVRLQSRRFSAVWGRRRLVLLSSLLLHDRPCGLAHGAAVAINGALQSVAETAQQMPPIRDLHRSRRSSAGSLGISTSTVAGDNLDPRMLAQPGRDGFAAAFGQEVDDAPALQVADDGAVALAAAPSPIIDADDPRRGVRVQVRRPDQPQQRVAADRHGQPTR